VGTIEINSTLIADKEQRGQRNPRGVCRAATDALYTRTPAKSTHDVVKRRARCSDGDSIFASPALAIRIVFRPKRLFTSSTSVVSLFDVSACAQKGLLGGGRGE
jgi:hypothetical protein